MKKLSSNNRIIKLTTPIIFGLIGLFGTYIVLRNELIWLIVAMAGIGGLSYFWFLKISSSAFDLYYDSDFLYLKSNQETKKIKIEKIKSIKATSARIRILGFPFYLYQMEFVNQNAMYEKVKFWLGTDDSKLSDFQKIIQTSSLKFK